MNKLKDLIQKFNKEIDKIILKNIKTKGFIHNNGLTELYKFNKIIERNFNQERKNLELTLEKEDQEIKLSTIKIETNESVVGIGIKGYKNLFSNKEKLFISIIYLFNNINNGKDVLVENIINCYNEKTNEKTNESIVENYVDKEEEEKEKETKKNKENFYREFENYISIYLQSKTFKDFIEDIEEKNSFKKDETTDYYTYNNEFNYIFIEEKEEKCNYIGKIQHEIEKIKKNIKEKKEKGKKEIFYRGQVNSNWKLEAGIFRHNIGDEKYIYKDIMSQIPNAFRNRNVYENLLTIQHYEGPTRLIDLTQNPLYGLFFACYDEFEKNKNEDGKIFIFEEKKENINYYDSDKVELIANLTRMDTTFCGQMKKEIKGDNKLQTLDNLIHFIGENKPHFRSIIKIDDLLKCYIVKGVYSNSRIENQTGDFLIIGAQKSRNLIDKSKSAEITQNTKNIIIINKKIKTDILEELKVINIHQGTVYPEINRKIKAIKENYPKT